MMALLSLHEFVSNLSLFCARICLVEDEAGSGYIIIYLCVVFFFA